MAVMDAWWKGGRIVVVVGLLFNRIEWLVSLLAVVAGGGRRLLRVVASSTADAVMGSSAFELFTFANHS